MIVYHYSVESFSKDDLELVSDYKHQFPIYAPFIQSLSLGVDFFKNMLYQCNYQQICAEAKQDRKFSFWVKDATEALFEFVRTKFFFENSCSRITGIFYCKDFDSCVTYLNEDCIKKSGFHPHDVEVFKVELQDDHAYTYDQAYYNQACEMIHSYEVEKAIEYAKSYFSNQRTKNPILEVLSFSKNKIIERIPWYEET